MAKPAKAAKKLPRPRGAKKPPLYILEVLLIGGPVTEDFARENPVVARTLQVRGDQTLADLHRAVFDAFGRHEEQMYEFQFGKGPADPEGRRYVLPGAQGMALEGSTPPAGSVTDTTLDALGLEAGHSFTYWFDFGADWWHRITVRAVAGEVPEAEYPKVLRRVGQDPPQYTEEERLGEVRPPDFSGGEAADVSCLIGELHLSKGDFPRAIEAFTRAIAVRPTADAHYGRARAYRGLAADDECRARELG